MRPRPVAPPADGGGRSRKHLAWRFGRWAEALCALRLRLAGYRILARDLRTPVGEIDLVARRGRLVAFVEVKARLGGGGAEALGPRQRRRIVRAAQLFLADRPELHGCDVRFDLMLLDRRRWPRHVPAAWRADD